MSDSKFQSRFRNSVLGFVLGDAVGVPYEFKTRTEMAKEPCVDMIGHGTHNQPIGTWSDDTSMMLILMEWIIEVSKKYNRDLTKIGFNDYVQLKSKWLKFYKSGYMTPHGVRFDIGTQISAALNETGLLNEHSMNQDAQGNGSLMRVLPFGSMLCRYPSDKKLLRHIMNNTNSITHANVVCNTHCEYYVNALCKEYSEYLSHTFPIQKVIPNSTGWVVDTTNTINHIMNTYCFVFFDEMAFKKTICAAVNMGGDTDTIAALVGGLLGSTHGSILPLDWLSKIVKLDMIENLISEFWEVVLK